MAEAVPVLSVATPHPIVTGPSAALGPRRVLDQLDGPERLVVVHAPRFGGATTLLRTWLGTVRRRDRVVADVLDPAAHTTEEEYWTGLLSTLAGSAPALPGPRPVAVDPDHAFDAVVDALSRQTAPCILVLDDFHLVPDPVGRVDELLAHAPPGGLRIRAATRVAGSWPDRLRWAEDARLVQPCELRLDHDEIVSHLRTTRSRWDSRSPEIIHRLTEGLPGLVHPVCVSVPERELVAPTHLDEHVQAVIDREVERVLTAAASLRDIRLPLLLSAAATPLTSRSAACLAGDPVQFLRDLELGGLAQPVGSPTDPEWHYPDSVRASLLRLCGSGSASASALREFRMALVHAWLDEDAPARALTVAGDLRDWSLVVRIVRDNLHTLYTRDYAITMTDEVLARVPEDHLADHPDLLRLRHVHHQFAAPRDTARAATDTATPDEPHVRGPADTGEPPDDTATFIRALELRVEGDYAGSARLCDLLTARPLPDPGSMSEQDRESQGFAHAHIGYSYIMTGRFTDALAALRRATRIATQDFVHRDAAGKLALVHALLGHITEARDHLAEERRHSALPPVTEALVRPAGDVAAALLALERSDLDTAAAVLGALGPPADREEFWGFILLAWGHLHLASGTPADGLRFLDAHQPRFAAMHNHGAVAAPLLAAVRADLNLACRRPSAAAEALAGVTHPLTAAARARLLLLTDDPYSALALANEAIVDPGSSTRVTLELELVAAAAALATGDRARAGRHLTTAALTHRISGLRAPFRTLPGHVMERLSELEADLPVDEPRPGPDYGSLTFVDADPTLLAVDGRSADTLPAPRLTKREREVLRALMTDASLKQIAAKSFVSANTVKSQVRAIYRKLGVTTRAAAVDKATRLGLG